MAEFPAFPLFTDAYLGDTTHLTTIEHGAYLLLMITMWRTKTGSLPDDDKLLARYAKLTTAQWARIRPIIETFFDVHDGQWTQGRLTDELVAVRQLSKRQSDKAKGRWLKNKEKPMPRQSRGNASPTPPNIEDTNVSSLQGEKSKMPTEFLMPDKTTLNFDQMFERWWHLYPAIRDKGSKVKAKEQLKIQIEKGTHYEIIGRGIGKYRQYCDRTGEKQPDMFRWLRDEGYNRDYATTEPANPRSGSGYSIESVLEKVMADKTHDPEGREDRLKALGIYDDTGD